MWSCKISRTTHQFVLQVRAKIIVMPSKHIFTQLNLHTNVYNQLKNWIWYCFLKVTNHQIIKLSSIKWSAITFIYTCLSWLSTLPISLSSFTGHNMHPCGAMWCNGLSLQGNHTGFCDNSAEAYVHVWSYMDDQVRVTSVTLKYSKDTHPIAWPFGWATECVLWVWYVDGFVVVENLEVLESLQGISASFILISVQIGKKSCWSQTKGQVNTCCQIWQQLSGA